MKFTNEQLINFSTEKLIAMKGKTVEVELTDGRKCRGILEKLREATNNFNLIAAIVVGEKTINLPQIKNLELID